MKKRATKRAASTPRSSCRRSSACPESRAEGGTEFTEDFLFEAGDMVSKRTIAAPDDHKEISQIRDFLDIFSLADMIMGSKSALLVLESRPRIRHRSQRETRGTEKDHRRGGSSRSCGYGFAR